MQIENAYIAKIVEGIQQALPPQNEYDKGYCDALQSFVISLSQAKGSFLNLQLIEDSVKTALDAHLNNAPELEMEEAVAKGADDHIGVKITSMSVEKFLQVLANFSREACASMNDGNGIRSGLYVRRVDDALKIRRIAPMELDDVDMMSGVVYPLVNL